MKASLREEERRKAIEDEKKQYEEIQLK